MGAVKKRLTEQMTDDSIMAMGEAEAGGLLKPMEPFDIKKVTKWQCPDGAGIPLITMPNVPRPLHGQGMQPRTIFGKTTWDFMRKRAYYNAGYKCEICGREPKKGDLHCLEAGTECYIEEAGNMVPCCGISYTIVHKDQLEKNPNILTDWFEEIEEPTRWKPEKFQNYYHVGGDGFVYSDTWVNTPYIDNGRFEIGNCFQTEEEAERVVEYLKALAVVRGDETTKFTKGRRNWFVCYDANENSLRSGCAFLRTWNGIFGLPYFATEDDARRSIEQHKKEWLTIFGIKEEE